MSSPYSTHIPQEAGRFSVANADLDSLLEDVSRQMTSSKLVRRLSNRQNPERRYPRSTETNRILKVSSTGNSPRKHERRRCIQTPTASQRSSYVEGVRQHNAALASRRNLRQARPTTWHPMRQSGYEELLFLNSSASHGVPMEAPPAFDASFQPTQTALTTPQQSLVPSFTPTSSYADTPYQSSSFDFNQSPLPFSNQQSTLWPNQYQDQILTFPQSNHALYPYNLSQFPCYLNQPISNPHMNINSSPPTPDEFFTMQKSSYLFEPSSSQDPFFSPRSDPIDEPVTGTELVGMGLYDDHKEPSSTTTAIAFEGDDATMMMISRMVGNNDICRMEGSGKGLKLEETWEPPEEDEDDDEDDEEEAESETSEQLKDERSKQDNEAASGDFHQQPLDAQPPPQQQRPTANSHLAEDGMMLIPAYAAGVLDGGWI